MTDEKKQEFTRRISQANTTDMVVIIYDITLYYIEEAKTAIESGNAGDLSSAIINIRKCLNELIGSLHYEYEPAGEMLQLYIFCSRQLVRAERERNTDILLTTKNIISRLREAYNQIADTNKSGAVMQNSQSVYAGLTYGRGALNESVIGSGNRGFLA